MATFIIKDSKVEEIVYDYEMHRGIQCYPTREMAQNWLDTKDIPIRYNLCTMERIY